jgi:hypothetical protein
MTRNTSEAEPRSILVEEFCRGSIFWQYRIDAIRLECIKNRRRGWAVNNERLLSPIKRKGLQKRQQTPCVIEMTVSEGNGNDTIWAKERRFSALFHSATLSRVSHLEPFACVNNDDAFLARKNTATDISR